MESNDLLALANNIRGNGDGWGGNSSIWFILVLFFLVGGNGWGNRGYDTGLATKDDVWSVNQGQTIQNTLNTLGASMSEGFNNQNIAFLQGQNNLTRDIDRNYSDLRHDICCGVNTTNQNILKSTYDETIAMNNGFNSVNQNMCNAASGIQAAIADNGFKMQDCCCQLKSLIKEDGEKTRALITANEIQGLRDQVAAKDRELLTSSLVTSNVLQTNNIEAYMRQLLAQYNSGLFNNSGCGCNC